MIKSMSFSSPLLGFELFANLFHSLDLDYGLGKHMWDIRALSITHKKLVVWWIGWWNEASHREERANMFIGIIGHEWRSRRNYVPRPYVYPASIQPRVQRIPNHAATDMDWNGFVHLDHYTLPGCNYHPSSQMYGPLENINNAYMPYQHREHERCGIRFFEHDYRFLYPDDSHIPTESIANECGKEEGTDSALRSWVFVSSLFLFLNSHHCHHSAFMVSEANDPGFRACAMSVVQLVWTSVHFSDPDTLRYALSVGLFA